jgi:hypothetical protein
MFGFIFPVSLAVDGVDQYYPSLQAFEIFSCILVDIANMVR